MLRHREIPRVALLTTYRVIVNGLRGPTVVRWHEESEPDCRHVGIDVNLDPSVHGKGLGKDAVRTLARWLIDVRGHHRLVIDPAADNAAAIRCYAKVGFRPIGMMRRYERGADGSWHDGLLMVLLVEEFGR